MKYAVSFLIIHLCFTISMGLLANEKINLKNKRFLLSFFVTWILLVLNFEYSISSIRVILNIGIYMLLAKLLFDKNFKESIILGMLVTILGICAEFAYVIITYPIFHYNSVLEEKINMVFVNNLGTGILMILFCVLKKIRNLYDMVLSSTNKISEKHIALFSLFIVAIFNFVSLISYYISKDLIDKFYFTLIGSFLYVFSAILIFLYFKTQSKYLTFYEKYNVSLESIREFEMTIERYRINTHENKNQFRTIRNMSKNKKIVSYIDALLTDNISDDEKLLIETQRIPAGGLRGIIYSKLLLMQQENIPFELVIDKKITIEKTNKIDDYTLTSVCRILGVLLDNAIEEVKKLDNKYIMVELYEEDKDIVISITNNYEGYVDIEAINNPGISSKGKNHGYGLSLVQKLVRKNKKIQQSSEFFEDNFMQKLIIKV